MGTHRFPRRVPHNIALLSLACWSFSATTASAQPSSQRVSSTLQSTAETKTKPGDDFFAYANAEWLEAAIIPVGMDRSTVRDAIDRRTQQQVASILDDARTAAPGTLARRVADFHSALLNQSAIENKGLTPLAPMLAEIDRVGDQLALTRLLGRTMRADVDPLNIGIYSSSSVLGLSVEHSIHGENRYTAFLLQGGLGLGERTKYLSTETAAVEQRGRYQKYIARLLTLAGFDRADQRAEAVLALETAIAETHASQSAMAVDRNADHRWSRADFAREAPGMDWDAFFEAAGLDGESEIVAWQPSPVQGVAALVASRPLEAWKDYLRFHLIAGYADVLPRAFAEATAGMSGDARTREERATATTQSAMSGAIGELYAARYFSSAQKARVRAIIGDVTAAFRTHVAHVSWLSAASKQLALAKLDRLYVGIGFPETRETWSDLRIDSSDAFGNVERVAERARRQALARLAKAYDPRDWVLTPQTVGAVLIFQQNAYEFAAALLQSPKYDSSASDAATYGAIGAIVGHDITHFVDVLGADYGPDGQMRRWWTSADSARFEQAAEPIVRQFSDYEPLPGAHVNGRLTRTENVADLGGLVAAFEAYRKSLGSKASNRAEVRRQDREFFLGFARAFGTKMNETGMRAQLANDHAPEMYRIDTVRNIDAWYEAFDVVPGQRLYLAPTARVRIW